MPDVAVVIGLPNGAATFTISPVGGDTATIPGARKFLIGPPVNGDPTMIGRFEVQVQSADAGETANTYRWVGDEPFNAAAPTSYSYFGDTFISLGGI